LEAEHTVVIGIGNPEHLAGRVVVSVVGVVQSLIGGERGLSRVLVLVA